MTATVIDQIPLLNTLSAARKEQWRRTTLRELYPKGALLFHQGDPAKYVWLVLEGWVHLVRHEAEHGAPNEAIVFTVTPQEMLCGVSAFEPGRYTVTGRAGTRVETLRIPGPLFIEAVEHEPRFAAAIVRCCAGRIRHMAEMAGGMAGPVPVRVNRALLRLRAQFGDEIPITHRELAQMAWTTTESAIRAVSRLKRDGVITGRRGIMRVERLPQLQRLVQAANGHPVAAAGSPRVS